MFIIAGLQLLPTKSQTKYLEMKQCIENYSLRGKNFRKFYLKKKKVL